MFAENDTKISQQSLNPGWLKYVWATRSGLLRFSQPLRASLPPTQRDTKGYCGLFGRCGLFGARCAFVGGTAASYCPHRTFENSWSYAWPDPRRHVAALPATVPSLEKGDATEGLNHIKNTGIKFLTLATRSRR